MKLTQAITFVSVKLYCLMTLIRLIILISHIAQLVLIRKFIFSVQVCIFPLNMCDIIIYVARWWEKYLSKRSLIKYTCSWRDKLIVLWTLNRQAKIFLHYFTYWKLQIYCSHLKNGARLRTFACPRALNRYWESNLSSTVYLFTDHWTKY